MGIISHENGAGTADIADRQLWIETAIRASIVEAEGDVGYISPELLQARLKAVYKSGILSLKEDPAPLILPGMASQLNVPDGYFEGRTGYVEGMVLDAWHVINHADV